MELKHKFFVGINTLEELALDRSKYFDKERHQQTDEWWIGKCFIAPHREETVQQYVKRQVDIRKQNHEIHNKTPYVLIIDISRMM